MKRKKILSMFLAAACSTALFVGCGKETQEKEGVYLPATTLMEGTTDTAAEKSGSSDTTAAQTEMIDEALYIGEYFDDVSTEPGLKIEKKEDGKIGERGCGCRLLRPCLCDHRQ